MRNAVRMGVVMIGIIMMSLTASARILNYGNMAEPEYMDPGLITGNVESNISRNVFEGLVGYDPKTLSPVPALAESWTISPDGKIYRFKIRANAVWSDGTPVTAQDFVYSWERVLNPKTGARYAMMLFDMKGATDYNNGTLKDPAQLGFRAIDEKTLELTLEHPVGYFLYVLAHETASAVPKWVVEKHKERWTLPQNIVVSGPFTIKSWVPQKELLVVKNPMYWDAANVRLEGVRYFPIEDRHTTFKKYENGELDIIREVPQVQIASLQGRPDLIQCPDLANYYFRVNVTRPGLDNVKLRQALAYAINRDVLVNQFLKGTEVSSSSITVSGMDGYTPAPGLDFNPEKAKQLLVEAGYGDPTTFPKLSILYNTDEMHRLVAQVVQQMWKQYLGIDVALYNEEWKSYLKSQNEMKYDISRSSWGGDYPDPNTFLDMYVSGSAMNQTGWKNAEYDGLIEAAAKETNPPKRMAILRKAETLLLQEAPVIPLFQRTRKYMMRQNVGGYFSNVQDIHPMKYVYFTDEAKATTVWGKIQTFIRNK